MKNEPPPLLHRHQVFQTKDLKEAQAFTTHIWSKHKSQTIDGSEYSSNISRLPLGHSALCLVDCPSSLRVEAEGSRSKAILYLPLSGSMEIFAGNQHLSAKPNAPVLIPAKTKIVFDATPIHCVLLEISSTALASELAAYGGAPAKLPPLGWKANTNGARSITKAIHFILEQLDSQETPSQHTAYRHRLEGFLLSTIACAITERLAIKDPSVTHIGCLSIQELQNWLTTQLHADLTPTKLATRAGITPRALQIAFLKHFHKTPSAYLRDLRLQAAHEELLASNSPQSVTRVALSLGFSHLGRFAAAYRKKFGVYPSTSHLSLSPLSKKRKGNTPSDG